MPTYNFDIVRVLTEYLPKKLRTTINLQFLASLIKPIRTVSSHFENFQKEGIRDVLHWGQVILLEHYLNNFSQATDYVYIDDGSEIFAIKYLYLNESDVADEDFTYLYEDETDLIAESGDYTYLYEPSDIANEQYDFVVVMSESDYNYQEVRNNINELVLKYKSAGFIHKLLYY